MFQKLKELTAVLAEKSKNLKNEALAVCAVDTKLWAEWCRDSGRSVPPGIEGEEMKAMDAILNTSPPFLPVRGTSLFPPQSRYPGTFGRFCRLD